MMEIDKMEAGRELDALVAERVMGWTALREPGKPHLWMPPEHFISGWRPSTDIAAAWQVHRKACELPFSKRREYLNHLQDVVSQRVMHQDVNSKVSWPDVMVFLEPVDFCRAALMAVEAK